jgi:hypothetical protein
VTRDWYHGELPTSSSIHEEHVKRSAVWVNNYSVHMGPLWGDLRKNFIYPVYVTARVSQVQYFQNDDSADPSFMVYKDLSVAGEGSDIMR